MNSTPKNLIYFVVIAIAILAFLGMGSLSVSLFFHVYADPAILTSLITLTSGLTGALVGVLANTRTQPAAGGDATTAMTSTITTTTTPTVSPINTGDTPTKVQVVNTPINPVPTSEEPQTKTP